MKKCFPQYCALLNINADEQHFKIFSQKYSKINLRELSCEYMKWTEMAQDKVQCCLSVMTVNFQLSLTAENYRTVEGLPKVLARPVAGC